VIRKEGEIRFYKIIAIPVLTYGPETRTEGKDRNSRNVIPYECSGMHIKGTKCKKGKVVPVLN
jgi:hypothetical protein